MSWGTRSYQAWALESPPPPSPATKVKSTRFSPVSTSTEREPPSSPATETPSGSDPGSMVSSYVPPAGSAMRNEPSAPLTAEASPLSLVALMDTPARAAPSGPLRTPTMAVSPAAAAAEGTARSAMNATIIATSTFDVRAITNASPRMSGFHA